jgi:hypothetical protein
VAAPQLCAYFDLPHNVGAHDTGYRPLHQLDSNQLARVTVPASVHGNNEGAQNFRAAQTD